MEQSNFLFGPGSQKEWVMKLGKKSGGWHLSWIRAGLTIDFHDHRN